MSGTETTILLPTNLREFITILEGLRVSVRPGRGLRQLDVRPTISPPLRTSEELLLTGEKPGEFPILLKVVLATSSPAANRQTSTMPIGSVQSAVFRSAAERDVVRNRSFDNASSDQLELLVDELLFSGTGEARFSSVVPSSDVEVESWIAADMIAGALVGALSAGRMHEGAKDLIGSFVRGELEPINLRDVVGDASGSRPASAAVAVMRSHYGNAGQDGQALLRELVDALSSTDLAPQLEAFDAHVSAVLASDEVRARGSLSDDKNMLLRALSMVVQRSSLDDVLADRIEGEPPGPRVLITAAALAGLREGLAHLPAVLKSADREFLGRTAALIEDRDPSIEAIVELASEAGIICSAEPTSQASDGSAQDSHVLEVCEWRRHTVVKRALSEVSTLPHGWRLFLREDETLCMEVPSVDAAEAAGSRILQWTGRSKRAPRRRQKTRTQDAEGVLPGLLDKEPDLPE